MSDQAQQWSKAARNYDEDFVDPFHPDADNPLLRWLQKREPKPEGTAADVGCGTGPLLPHLSERFGTVHAIDFAKTMIDKAKERCQRLDNVEFHQRSMTDLSPFAGSVDLAVACNSLVLPDLAELTTALGQIYAMLKPGGRFLGIVPSMDGVHYLTMLVYERAVEQGMDDARARKHTAHHVEHELYDFEFTGFRFKGLRQHFWYPFEIRHRLKRVGFRRIRLGKVRLPWMQFDALSRDLEHYPCPWDWFFSARKPLRSRE